MNDVLARARELGLYVATWTPGDGMRRYKFTRDDVLYDATDGLYVAGGKRDALIWLSGYASGRNGR